MRQNVVIDIPMSFDFNLPSCGDDIVIILPNNVNASLANDVQTSYDTSALSHRCMEHQTLRFSLVQRKSQRLLQSLMFSVQILFPFTSKANAYLCIHQVLSEVENRIMLICDIHAFISASRVSEHACADGF